MAPRIKITFISLLLAAAVSSRTLQDDPIIKRLYEKVVDLQQQKQEEFPMLKQAGSFGSDVKLNFHGNPLLSDFREQFSIYDNNVFVTMWIVECLVEANVYGTAPKPDEHVMNFALKAVQDFQDKNRPYNNSIMTFWPQAFNKTTQSWESSPQNLLRMFSLTDYVDWDIVGKIMDDLGLGQLWKELDQLLKDRDAYLQAFRIPPDMDDTSINIGMGGLLSRHADIFPSVAASWKNDNTNLTSALTAMKRYAYRPFSSNKNVNTIDPRTYFYIRHFLEDAQKAQQDVALVATWVQDLGEVEKMNAKHVAMPLFINNVDSVVGTNAVYGLTSAMLSDLPEGQAILADPELLKIYSNTSSLVAWVINHNISSRPDLALTYYPSRMNFYWFSARTLFILETTNHLGMRLAPVLYETLQLFRTALRVGATNDIIARAKSDADGAYFDGFIGEADLDQHGNPAPKHDDRLCNTAVAANALIASWTVFYQGKLKWVDGTTEQVKTLITDSVRWVTANAFKSGIKTQNSFFSGSVKGYSTYPYSYPANRYDYLNGTHVPKGHYSLDAFLGMEGVMTEAEYMEWIKDKKTFVPTPMDFHGYNSDNSTWPFWSSEAFTYGSALLATAQYSNIAQ